MNSFAHIKGGKKLYFDSADKCKEVLTCLKHLHTYLAQSAADCRWTLFYQALNLYCYLVVGLNGHGGIAGTLILSVTKQLHRIHDLCYCQLAKEFPLGPEEIKTDENHHQSKAVQQVEPMQQPIVLHMRISRLMQMAPERRSRDCCTSDTCYSLKVCIKRRRNPRTRKN